MRDTLTVKQKQALLAYLGCYDGPLDGLWGEKSQRATIDFQRSYMDATAVDGIFGAATEKRILDVIATGENTKESIQIDTWNASYASVYLHSNSYHHAMGVDIQLSHNL